MKPSRSNSRFALLPMALLSALAAIALQGCAREPMPILAPVAPSAGSTSVPILTITTRAPDVDAGLMFTGERGSQVSLSSINVTIPPERVVGAVQWPRQAPANPAREFSVSSAKSIDRAQAVAWIKAHAGRQRRMFVYVHGFNVPFGQGVFRFAQMIHDSQMAAAPVLFSWPSRGRLLDYKRDLDNATYSRTDLANFLRLAAASPAVDEIIVFAHSMGSWLAVEAVRELALEKGGTPVKIRNLILAAPDLDVGVFRRQIIDMGSRRPTLTLFISQSDRALQLSQFLARGGARLGAVDLSADHYREQLKQLRDVNVIDLTALRQGDRINHSLYAASPETVRLIGRQLVEGQPLGGVDSSGGFEVVETIGSAARLIIATPVLIFDATAER
ncbi:MAG: alpha/beta hydrolase [Beijerinckiaceae bacterium]|nr:alpha/beta hydrolase [Beijerinckiaceae bacterium]